MSDMHIISDDEYSHIESETCWCNPRISQSEGQTYYIHNSNYNLDIETKDREINNEERNKSRSDKK